MPNLLLLCLIPPSAQPPPPRKEPAVQGSKQTAPPRYRPLLTRPPCNFSKLSQTKKKIQRTETETKKPSMLPSASYSPTLQLFKTFTSIVKSFQVLYINLYRVQSTEKLSSLMKQMINPLSKREDLTFYHKNPLLKRTKEILC